VKSEPVGVPEVHQKAGSGDLRTPTAVPSPLASSSPALNLRLDSNLHLRAGMADPRSGAKVLSHFLQIFCGYQSIMAKDLTNT
jgi:hypothetical protein